MGRPPSGRVPPQSITRMQERYYEIMRRLIAGETQAKIATDLVISQARLSVICNSPVFQRELCRRRAEVDKRFTETTGDIKARLEKLQDKAVDVLELIITKDKEASGAAIPLRLKKETAMDVVELVGTVRKQHSGNGIEDVVKLISEGFKTAQENRKKELELEEERRRLKNITVDVTVDNSGENNGEPAELSDTNSVPKQISAESADVIECTA